MKKEYQKNLEYYERIRGLYPTGRWIGIVNQKVVAEHYVRFVVEEKTKEAVKQWAGPDIELDPSVCFKVGYEHVQSPVFFLESQEQDPFHASPTSLANWNHVAKPLHNELEPSVTMDKNWVKFRFIGDELRPYMSVAVSLQEGGPYFPMTFFIDTGSTDNFIKRSAFDIISVKKEMALGIKYLWIGGKEFAFKKPGASEIHNNLNLLGTSCLYHSPYLVDELSKAMKLNAQEKLAIMEQGMERPPSDWK